jgi:hypothetical protein
MHERRRCSTHKCCCIRVHSAHDWHLWAQYRWNQILTRLCFARLADWVWVVVVLDNPCFMRWGEGSSWTPTCGHESHHICSTSRLCHMWIRQRTPGYSSTCRTRNRAAHWLHNTRRLCTSLNRLTAVTSPANVFLSGDNFHETSIYFPFVPCCWWEHGNMSTSFFIHSLAQVNLNSCTTRKKRQSTHAAPNALSIYCICLCAEKYVVFAVCVSGENIKLSNGKTEFSLGKHVFFADIFLEIQRVSQGAQMII